MAGLTQQALDDLNEAVSRLAHWISAADDRALMRISQGFGAAVARSAAMREEGAAPASITLALAEEARALQAAKDARHAGWLLLSLQVELLNETSSRTPQLPGGEAEDLAREIETIGLDLMRRATRVLAA